MKKDLKHYIQKVYYEDVAMSQIKNMFGQSTSFLNIDDEEKNELREKFISDKFINSVNQITRKLKEDGVQQGGENEKSIIQWLIKNTVNKNFIIDNIDEDVDVIFNSLKYFFENKQINKDLKGKKLIDIKIDDLKKWSKDINKQKK